MYVCDSCVWERVNIRNPSLQRKRALWMGIRRSHWSIRWCGYMAVLLQEKDILYIYIMWRRRRKNVFLYIIIGPHLYWIKRKSVSVYYIYYTYNKGRVFLGLGRLRFGRDFIVHRIFNNDRRKWPIHDLYIYIHYMCAHIINPDRIYSAIRV